MRLPRSSVLRGLCNVLSELLVELSGWLMVISTTSPTVTPSLTKSTGTKPSAKLLGLLSSVRIDPHP